MVKYLVINNDITLYNTWNECKDATHKVKGVKFKKCNTEYDIVKFLLDNNIDCNIIKQFLTQNNISHKYIDSILENTKLNKNTNYINKKDNIVIAYVDGSYNIKTKYFGSGVVLLDKEENIIETFSIGTFHEEVSQMRQIGGELKACMLAVKYAVEKKYENIDIYYDYFGIEKWITGEWKAKSEFTMAYKKYILNQSKNINIHFYKVKAHSKNKWNDVADKLAKESIQVK